ncbi:MAG: hypothetical protein HYX68_08120 [Planctomycetes bacterium]|nr:hypothetical protein [Planctomycetota bacterium]
MTFPLSSSTPGAIDAPVQFVVSHGRSGALGIFTAVAFQPFRRGQRVLVRTQRGIETGTVLGPANSRQAMLLHTTSDGQLLRSVNADDEALRGRLLLVEQEIFTKSRAWAARDGLDVEVLDVELLFDGSLAIVQFVGPDADAEKLAVTLEQKFELPIRLENLAAPTAHEETNHGCDKPDCGRGAGGGCSTCSTGGGCSTCGSSKVDLREYFGHLRVKMEEKHRIPLA